MYEAEVAETIKQVDQELQVQRTKDILQRMITIDSPLGYLVAVLNHESVGPFAVDFTIGDIVQQTKMSAPKTKSGRRKHGANLKQLMEGLQQYAQGKENAKKSSELMDLMGIHDKKRRGILTCLLSKAVNKNAGVRAVVRDSSKRGKLYYV